MNTQALKTLLIVAIHTRACGGLEVAGTNWHNNRRASLNELEAWRYVERLTTDDPRGHGLEFRATAAGFQALEEIKK